ncbi:hypothetical protein F4779DRAFT_559160 [Xylariaceae sp. FL0662B]|nr:hypothetical protein F4779DRAFT_559160 [Xylariaceae sp. FL0662B]
MKPLVSYARILLATSVGAQAPPQLPGISGIETTSSNQCSPNKKLDITITPNNLELGLPALQFYPLGHGRTDEYTGCSITVELVEWFYKWRFAVSNVTYYGHANLTQDVSIYQLTAKTTFRLEHLKNSHPITPPRVTNLSEAIMIDSVEATAIGGAGDFDDDFAVQGTARPSPLVWSPCFDGGEGEGFDTTKLVFDVSATTRDPTGQGTGRLVAGLTLSFGLVWQECLPYLAEKLAWGRTRVDDWETCTYREANQTAAAAAARRDLRPGVPSLGFRPR